MNENLLQEVLELEQSLRDAMRGEEERLQAELVELRRELAAASMAEAIRLATERETVLAAARAQVTAEGEALLRQTVGRVAVLTALDDRQLDRMLLRHLAMVVPEPPP